VRTYGRKSEEWEAGGHSNTLADKKAFMRVLKMCGVGKTSNAGNMEIGQGPGKAQREKEQENPKSSKAVDVCDLLISYLPIQNDNQDGYRS